MPQRFHLGWFTSFAPPAWNSDFSGTDGATWTDGRFHMDMVQALERARFDYIMFEDSSMVSDAFKGSSEADLKYSLYAPKHDPLPLIPLLASCTSRIGIIATASTSFYPPFMLARSMSTMDHLTHGRVGWNIVTSSENRAAQNYSLEKLPDHDNRYDRADEFVEVVEALWESWEPDARVMDRETGTYVDHTKVHTIDHQGEYFSVRGPLNTLPMPQGKPVICQAGGSPRGRQFAAAHADTIVAQARGVESMKAYRDDIRARATALGRDPDSIKLLFPIRPVIGATMEDALELDRRRIEAAADGVEAALANMSALTEIDFSQFDLDSPLPESVETNGHRTTLKEFARLGAGGRTLREIAATWTIWAIDLVGTVDSIADEMGRVIDEVGGDGFLICGPASREYIGEITDGLVPALQRRGLARVEYTHEHLRDNLTDF